VDLYLVVCIFVVFGALMEYAAILLLLKQRRKPKYTIDSGLKKMFAAESAAAAATAANNGGAGASSDDPLCRQRRRNVSQRQAARGTHLLSGSDGREGAPAMKIYAGWRRRTRPV